VRSTYPPTIALGRDMFKIIRAWPLFFKNFCVKLKKMGMILNHDKSRVILSSSHADQALTLKALFSKGGLRQVDWARLFQSSQTSVKAMANKGRLLLKALQSGQGAWRSGVYSTR